jgi:hypothetical protein
MVRRKASRTEKGTNISQNKIKRTTKKRTRISSAQRKVTATRPNRKFKDRSKNPQRILRDSVKRLGIQISNRKDQKEFIKLGE